MYHRVLRTKESKIMIALLTLIVLITGIIIFANYRTNKKFEEQSVMAKEYLEAGNYEQAVEAYLKAMSMRNSDKELLSIGLAEAYLGVNNYDKALEVLRNSYQDKGGNTIKEKIEEVTLKKTNYEFQQIISHANTYYYNKEYEKAITEYEKAKLIKSKAVISYQRIAEAYIALGNYQLAREEVLEGLALTQSDELNKTLYKVDSYLLKVQYDAVLAEASEYIYQENYEDAIKKYNEALNLMPKEETAYGGLAETYLTLGEYEKAINMLNKYLEDSNSKRLNELLDTATALQAEKEERRSILLDLYTAVNNAKSDKIIDIMKNSFFIEKIATGTPIYYSSAGEGSIPSEEGMIIMDTNNIYSGGLNDGMKKGFGIHFMLLQDKKEKGWYYYRGEWSNGIPNGKGEIKEELNEMDDKGKNLKKQVVIRGNFVNGLEDGTMNRYYYVNGKETGNIRYSVNKGIPIPLQKEEDNEIMIEDRKQYAIGEMYLKDEPLGLYQFVDSDTIWGVRSYTKTHK